MTVARVGRGLLVVAILLSIVSSAEAHFLWIKSGADEGKVSMRSGFGDPDSWEVDVPEKIHQARYFVRGLDGKESSVSPKFQEDTGEFVGALEHAEPAVVVGVLEYGAFGGGGGKPFMLRYFAKHLGGSPSEWGKLQPSPRLSIEAVVELVGKDVRVTVLAAGKPLPEAELKLYGPSESKAKTAKTGPDGTFLWEGEGPGDYALYTHHKLPGKGMHEGKNYDGIREYGTLTFTLPESVSAAAAK